MDLLKLSPKFIETYYEKIYESWFEHEIYKIKNIDNYYSHDNTKHDVDIILKCNNIYSFYLNSGRPISQNKPTISELIKFITSQSVIKAQQYIKNWFGEGSNNVDGEIDVENNIVNDNKTDKLNELFEQLKTLQDKHGEEFSFDPEPGSKPEPIYMDIYDHIDTMSEVQIHPNEFTSFMTEWLEFLKKDGNKENNETVIEFLKTHFNVTDTFIESLKTKLIFENGYVINFDTFYNEILVKK